MSQLIVRDTEGHDVLTRVLSVDEYEVYYRAYQNAETVVFHNKRWKLHSIARTRPERNLVLCVSFEGWDGDCE
jgi:hypothetical protein